MRTQTVTWLSPQAGGAWKRLDMRMQPTDDNPRKVRPYVTYSLACLLARLLLARLLAHLLTTCGLACLGGSVHDPRDLLARATVADAARLRPKQRTARRLHIEPGTLTMAIVSIAVASLTMDVLTVAILEPERRSQAHGWASRWARLLSHPRRRGALVGFRRLRPLPNRVAASAAYGSGSCLCFRLLTLLIQQMYAALTHESIHTHLPR